MACAFGRPSLLLFGRSNVRVGSRAREGVGYRGHCATGRSGRYCGHPALDVYYGTETGPGPLVKAAGPEIRVTAKSSPS